MAVHIPAGYDINQKIIMQNSIKKGENAKPKKRKKKSTLKWLNCLPINFPNKKLKSNSI